MIIIRWKAVEQEVTTALINLTSVDELFVKLE